jgi:Exportin 1-like protein
MVLRTLPDEIVVFNDTSTTSSSSSTLTEQRKKDLMAGINQGLAALFSFFYSLLEQNFSSYLKNKVSSFIFYFSFFI